MGIRRSELGRSQATALVGLREGATDPSFIDPSLDGQVLSIDGHTTPLEHFTKKSSCIYPWQLHGFLCA
jgi:hypothetical protein